MNSKEKLIVSSMNLKATHSKGMTYIKGEIPTAMYNKIMYGTLTPPKSKPTKTKPKGAPKPPAWAVPLLADIASLKADMSVVKADIAQLKTDVAILKTEVAQLKIDVEVLKVNQAADHALLVQVARDVELMKSTPTMKRELAMMENENKLEN